MPPGSELADGLGLLSAALDDPGVDLVATLNRLAADTTLAVPTFLGMSLTITGGMSPVVFTALDPPQAASIETSLLLPLIAGPGANGRTVCLVLYASAAGAFVDLAADLEWLTGIGTFVLDQHLKPPVDADAVGTLHAESVVNQAIGFLIAGGLTHGAAQRRVAELARTTGQHRHIAAASILDAAIGADPAS